MRSSRNETRLKTGSGFTQEKSLLAVLQNIGGDVKNLWFLQERRDRVAYGKARKSAALTNGWNSSAPGSTRSEWGGRVWRRGGTSVCCSSGILKASTASVASHGGRRTRWRCAVSWERG